MVPAPVRAVVSGALVLAPGLGAALAAFILAAACAAVVAARFDLTAAGEAPRTRFVLTPGRNTGAGFVFATAGDATVTALVPNGFPALSEERPQPVSVTASSAAATASRPARRCVSARPKWAVPECWQIGRAHV